MTIPEQAVQAATAVIRAHDNEAWGEDCGDEPYADLVTRMLTAATPHLAAVQVKADPWVDTRLVRFDDTIVFGRGGFDFDRWESLRWEMHTRHGSFAVWKSNSKTWSMYGGKYGFLMLDRFSSEEEAKEEAEQIVISLDDEPYAGRAAVLEEAAQVAEQFRNKDWIAHDIRTGVFPKQSEPGVAIAAAIRALASPDHADVGKDEGDGWLPIESAPDHKQGPFLVTNNPKALNAFGRPSHVWCVGSIHKEDDGSFCAFDGYRKIHDLKMFAVVSAPSQEVAGS
ncbi:hypothetical protein [Brucella intermedia]|uniref:hypothetical protein n=1 Tax=Brucella intermedia TaxID=94625 RepID=UPI00124D232E|nr:hypothetical protein [Brucella intermedia]KAB2725445.1 hypothetical protein F9L02_19695 [Brucella intermedia]